MISIDINRDDALQSVVNVFISGMLPHKDYDAEYFSEIKSVLFNYIKLEEFSLAHYVLLKMLDDINKIKIININFEPRLTLDILKTQLEVSVEDLISVPEVKMVSHLRRNNIPSDFSIETNRVKAMQVLYSMTLELYEKCMNLEMKSSSVLNYTTELEEALIFHVSQYSIEIQNKILIDSFKIGNDVFVGSRGCIKFNSLITTELNKRICLAKNNSSLDIIDCVEKSSTLDLEMKQSFIPIAEWGIPELDDGTPILRHRLVTVVGSVNIGKSMFSKQTAVNVIRSGAKVLYMYGEGSKAQVWADLILAYVYNEFGKFLLRDHVVNTELYSDDIQKLVGIAKAKLYNSGLIAFREAYSYDNLHEEVIQDYDKFKFDLLIIDHSLALQSTGRSTSTENVSNLAITCRNIKRKLPVCILVTSHPSSEAKSYLARGQAIPSDVTVTRESQTLEAESDELFILSDNQTLANQGLIALTTKKRRFKGKLKHPVYLTKQYDVCSLVYDESYQATEDCDMMEIEQAICNLENTYSGDSDDVYTI